MNLLATSEELAVLQQRASLAGEVGVTASVSLAWHLRQRDGEAALAQADMAELALLADETLPAVLRQCLGARLLLLRAELRWLAADLQGASLALREADARFLAVGDDIGRGDCSWLDAAVLDDLGQGQAAMSALDEAQAAYQAGGDGLRVGQVQARQIRALAFSDLAAAAEALRRQFPAASEQALPPELGLFVAVARGLVEAMTNDLGSAIQHFMQAHTLAQGFGQARLASIMANNVADTFVRLGDFEHGLEWHERALQLARRHAWPASLGTALSKLGDVLRLLGRFDEARSFLLESEAQLACLSGSRPFSTVLNVLGLLALDCGEPAEALPRFQALEVHAQASMAADMLEFAWRGQAASYLGLGLIEEAQACANKALQQACAQGDSVGQIRALSLLAQASDGPAALAFLQQAQRLGQGIQGYATPADLHRQLAKAHAACGDYEAAYASALAAQEAHTKTHTAALERRSLALQIQHQLDSARAEAAHHRQAAAALQASIGVLESLGAIGREITASLDTQAVLAALRQHVNELLDAACFVIYLMDEPSAELAMAVGVENGQALEPDRLALNDPERVVARCARERAEIVLNLAPDGLDEVPEVWPGTLETWSLLYGPLLAGERLIGVMTIQSPQRDAYGERELAIFRALCAYGAIALDNAAAYAQAASAQRRADLALNRLKQTQDELIHHEKLASLGALVAGIAHELNTPIGNSLLVASTLRDSSLHLLRQLEAGALRRSELTQYAHSLGDSAGLLSRNIEKAAELVSSFKQLAVDQTSDQRRQFDLAKVCAEVALTLRQRVNLAGHRMEIDVPAGLQMDSYPGPLGQVISNLIINSLVHGLRERLDGVIRLSAVPAETDAGLALVCLRFSDDGVGIPAQHLERVFDPFFTTRLGQGGSGLGLHICYNIVRSMLGGNIAVSSPPGGGAAFEIVMPCVAPQRLSV
ncbi:ATP-binding protein [Paucibacter sp. KCTC 42545]|uniref:ATP-binding protein n=1 Tax=Paucibacter sp. KCTC 42545 TaxID=1768242 RepID=UPI0018D240B8|nr:ATP-binding protein [Paucibacter sp. KCTC 42545]